jgi:pyridoxal phosphate enzyme (YggS family)
MAAFADVQDNVARIKRDIDESLDKSGRKGASVAIIAVTKTLPADAVTAVVAAGITDIGESRVKETAEKKPSVTVSCKWHLIGHLQKNKVNKALDLYDMLHSVDSYELAEAIDARAQSPVDILVQVNSSGEETKFGLDPELVTDVIRRIGGLKKIMVRGLMTIGPLTDDETQIRHSFRMTRSLFDDLKGLDLPNCRMEYLSMGMSGDYRIAVEEGSNMVRIGTALFGKRG